MSEYALDSSAVLAYLNQEEGWERVETMLLDHRCYLLALNLAEVLTRPVGWQVPLEFKGWTPPRWGAIAHP